MPPRYAYWTILVDDQPTAFRSGAKEDLLPTFNRLKEKQPSAVMKWFQNGKLWESRLDAQEAMRARGEMGRRGDERQAGFRSRDSDRRPARGQSDGGKRTAWTPRGEPSAPAPARNADDKLDWKPKGEFTPAPKRSDRTDWKSAAKPEWKSKGSFDREQKREWKPKSHAPGPKFSDRKPESFKRPDFKRSGDDSRPAKPEWKPKGSFDREAKREWKPKPHATSPKSSDWKPKSFKRPDFKRSGDDSRAAKPEWKPKGSFDREAKREWKPATSRPPAGGRKDRGERPEWTAKSQSRSPKSSEKLDWKPKGEFTPAPKRSERAGWKPKGVAGEGEAGSPEKRKWVPKAEYKKSQGIEARKDKNWRPGGEHKDPRQKYKDAKKAKWTRFKTTIRTRWESKQGKGPGKKGSQ